MATDKKRPRGWNADPAMKAIPDDERPIFDPAHKDAAAKLEECKAQVEQLKARYAPKGK